MAQRGELHPILQEEPKLPLHLAPIWDGFFELGREESGRPLLSEMQLYLRECLDVHDRAEQREIRQHWWSMAGVEMELQDRKTKAIQQKADQQAAKASKKDPAILGDGN